MKNKILIASCLCLLGFSAFVVSTNYSDMDGIVDQYKTTTNGSFFRKHLRVAENLLVSAGEEISDTIRNILQAPGDTNVDNWIAYVNSIEISETRRKILLESLDCVKNGVVYHQLRAGMGSPASCLVSCDSQLHPSASTYSFALQAAHNINDPLYLDCSFFVKHCYWAGGLAMASSSTSGMYPDGEFTSIDVSQLVPGDIAVHRTTRNGRTSGHVLIYLGKTEDGQLAWSEASAHANDTRISIMTPHESNPNYRYKRFGALAGDTTFGEGTSSGDTSTDNVTAGTQTVSWSDSWSMAKAEMKHPDTLNKYVPDNYNGHTVFLNPGHGDGSALASSIPNDPNGTVNNQYSGTASKGHTSGTTINPSSGGSVSEAQYVLEVAELTKDILLSKGYAVVMAREELVNNFENSARSVFANNTSDIHVALHIDAGTHGPGWYRPNAAQRAQANFATYASESNELGEAIENAMSAKLSKPVFTGLSGALTGYNYSTIPCVYIEMFGVESTEMSDFAMTHKTESAEGIAEGIDNYFR